MPKIASHHLAGDPLRSSDPYTPSNDWADDVTVQWGGSGIVLGKESYQTAFFEAFPAKGGFIRGEGKTIAEAEKDALQKWKRESACDHVWGRAHYTNGAALCKRCKAFGSKTFQPILRLGSWRDGVDVTDLESIITGWLRGSDHRPLNEEYKFLRQRWLRARVSGINLPHIPQENMTRDQFMCYVRDPYREACREAVAEWLDEGNTGLTANEISRLQSRIDADRQSDARITAKLANDP